MGPRFAAARAPWAQLRRLRSVGVLLLAWTSCLRPEGGALSDLEGARTFVVLNLEQALDGRPNSTLIVDAPLGRLTSLDPANTHLLAYPFTAAQLGWRPGPMTLRAGGPDRCGPGLRPLPIPDQVRSLGEGGEWSTALDREHLVELCAPEPTMVDCLSSGGCFRELPYPGELFCDLSCPTPPPPIRPNPPVAPMAPAPPDLGCAGSDADCRLSAELCLGPNPPPPHAALYCRHQSVSCPGGPFAPRPDGVTPVYVAADASGPGDGSINAPYPDLTTAIQERPGAPVWLAPGDYAVPESLPEGLQVIGACARPTHLRGPLPEVGALTLEGLTVDGPLAVHDANLRDVRVLGGPGLEPLLRITGTVALDGVSLEGPAPLGLHLLPGAEARASEVVSTDLEVLAQLESGTLRLDDWHHYGALGSGIVAKEGATLEAERLVLEDVAGRGLDLSASTASVADAWINATHQPAIYLVEQTSAHLWRVALRTQDVGPIEARDSALFGQDLELDNPASPAPALYVETSTVQLERIRLRCGRMGVLLRASRASPVPARITDLDAESVAPCGPEFVGLVFVEPGYSIQLERAHLRNAKVGIWVAGGSQLEGQDLEVGRASGACTRDNGVQVDEGGQLSAQRLRLYNLTDHAVLSQGNGSALRLEDLEILGVDETLETTEAIALNLSGRQGLMPIDRAWIHGRFGPVLRIGADTELKIRDLHLEQRGFDAVAQFNQHANVDLANFLIEGHGPGLVMGIDAMVTLHDGLIRGLAPGLQTPTEPDRGRLEGVRVVDTACAYEARDEATQCR